MRGRIKKWICALLSMALLLGGFVNVTTPKAQAANPWVNNADISWIDPSKKIVAFTFDDGPVGTAPTASSQRILDVLEKYGMHCTYFYWGEKINDFNLPEIRRAYSLGCELGNHSFTHPYLTNMSASQITQEISKTNDLLAPISGNTRTLVRPPYGATNQTVQQTIDAPLINWSLDSADWNNGNYNSVVTKIRNNLKDGDIILFHQTYDFTAQAIETLVPELIEKGYVIVSVSELMKIKGVNLQPGTVYANQAQNKRNIETGYENIGLVIDKIAAIGTVTLDSEAAIAAARAAYNALTDAQKTRVENYDTLIVAEATYKALIAMEAADKAAAADVHDKIAAIGTVTLDSETAITVARAAYNALTDAQKARVENYSTLTDAEAALKALQDAAAAEIAKKLKASLIVYPRSTQPRVARVFSVRDLVIYMNTYCSDEELSDFAEYFDKTKYDEAFFEDHYLCFALAAVTGSTPKYNISAITETKTAFNLEMTRADEPVSPDMASWILVLELSRSLPDMEVYLNAEKLTYLPGEAVVAVETQISDIEEPLSPESEAKLIAIRAAFDALTPEQQALVSNAAALIDAEGRMELIKAAEQRRKENQKVADKVVQLIDAIGTVTLDSRAAITAARSAFDALTVEQLVLLPNVETAIQTLIHAEIRFAELCENMPFTDVSGWYMDAVRYVYQNKLMNGISDVLFAPDGTLTRGQLVTILYRVEGAPKVTFEQRFSDVAAGKYYSDAVIWAVQNGCVKGYPDATFHPDASITREQIAAILYRYSGSPAVTGSFAAFPDGSAVSDYAKSAMLWATQTGLITGTKINGVAYLAPQASATRAQIATIIKRFRTSV